MTNIEKLIIFDPMKYSDIAPGLYISKVSKNIDFEDNVVGEIEFDMIMNKKLSKLYTTGAGRSHLINILRYFKKNYRLLIDNNKKDSELINVINDNISTNDEFQYSKYAEAFLKL